VSVASLSGWLLSIMLTAVPPGHRSEPAEARESKEQAIARYTAIADAMARVALDPKEQPLFTGEDAREKTALLMLTISLYESHWRRDVDYGLGRQAKRRYRCLMQIAVPTGKTPEGWTGRDLVKSRERCFRRALHILQRGRKHCADHGKRAFLNHYASGYCDRGKKAVDKRWRKFDELTRKHPLPRPEE
jgi:hypothetical protein